MAPWSPQKEYQRQRVTTASPMELIRMLYEAGVQTVDEALEAQRSGDILRRGRLVTKAVSVISELRLSLRREVDPAYCDTLSGLYSYLQRQLIRAYVEKSDACFQEVARLLRTLLEGWIGAMKNLDASRNPSAFSEAGAEDLSVSVSLPNPAYAEGRQSPHRSWQF